MGLGLAKNEGRIKFTLSASLFILKDDFDYRKWKKGAIL